MKQLFLIALLLPCAAQAQDANTNTVVQIVVANQQSASASVLSSDGTTAHHLPVGEGPHEAAISADGKIAVVSIYGAQVPGNQLAVIDLARDTVTRIIDLGSYTRPHGMVFISDSPKRIAITSETTSSVVIVNIDGGSVEGAIPTNARGSHMLAVPRDHLHGYTANVGANTVSEIDFMKRTFVRSFAVPARPEGIAVTPDGSEVWVGSNQTGAVTVIATYSGEITHTISGILFPYRLAASPNGKLMAIVDGNGNKLHIADVATHKILGAIDVASPRGIAFGADSKSAYVTLEDGLVAAIDVPALKVTKTFAVQSSPDGIAVHSN